MHFRSRDFWGRVVAMIWIGIIGQACFAYSALGQQSQPLPRPTISPYLQLGRTDSGPLPNYHAFVQPHLQFQKQQQMEWKAIQQFESRISKNANELRATGRGGQYMNTLHFYQPRQSRP